MYSKWLRIMKLYLNHRILLICTTKTRFSTNYKTNACICFVVIENVIKLIKTLNPYFVPVLFPANGIQNNTHTHNRIHQHWISEIEAFQIYFNPMIFFFSPCICFVFSRSCFIKNFHGAHAVFVNKFLICSKLHKTNK